MKPSTITTHIGRFFLGVQRIAIGCACVAAIVLGLYLAYLEKVTAASACFTAGIILFLLSNLELFESFKAPGIQATMRQIDDKVEHVERLADQVAKTSTVTAEFCMEIMARLGRASGPIPREQALKLVRAMSEQLLSLGVEEKRVNTLLEPWRNSVTLDLLKLAYSGLEHAVLRIQQQAEDIGKALSKPINPESPQFLQYQAHQAEANEWRKRMAPVGLAKGPEQVKLIESVYRGLIDRYGVASIDDQEKVEESLRHAAHFVANRDFLDARYWIDSDPIRTFLLIE